MATIALENKLFDASNLKPPRVRTMPDSSTLDIVSALTNQQGGNLGEGTSLKAENNVMNTIPSSILSSLDRTKSALDIQTLANTLPSAGSRNILNLEAGSSFLNAMNSQTSSPIIPGFTANRDIAATLQRITEPIRQKVDSTFVQPQTVATNLNVLFNSSKIAKPDSLASVVVVSPTTNPNIKVDGAGFTAQGTFNVMQTGGQVTMGSLPPSKINIDMQFSPNDTGANNLGITSIQTDGSFLGFPSDGLSRRSKASSSADTKFHDQTSLLNMISQQISQRQDPLPPIFPTLAEPKFPSGRMPFTGPASAWDRKPTLPQQVDLYIPLSSQPSQPTVRVDIGTPPPPPITVPKRPPISRISTPAPTESVLISQKNNIDGTGTGLWPFDVTGTKPSFSDVSNTGLAAGDVSGVGMPASSVFGSSAVDVTRTDPPAFGVTSPDLTSFDNSGASLSVSSVSGSGLSIFDSSGTASPATGASRTGLSPFDVTGTSAAINSIETGISSFDITGSGLSAFDVPLAEKSAVNKTLPDTSIYTSVTDLPPIVPAYFGSQSTATIPTLPTPLSTDIKPIYEPVTELPPVLPVDIGLPPHIKEPILPAPAPTVEIIAISNLPSTVPSTQTQPLPLVTTPRPTINTAHTDKPITSITSNQNSGTKDVITDKPGQADILQYDMTPFAANGNWAIFDPTALPPNVNFTDLGPVIDIAIDPNEISFTNSQDLSFSNMFGHSASNTTPKNQISHSPIHQSRDMGGKTSSKSITQTGERKNKRKPERQNRNSQKTSKIKTVDAKTDQTAIVPTTMLPITIGTSPVPNDQIHLSQIIPIGQDPSFIPDVGFQQISDPGYPAMNQLSVDLPPPPPF